MTAIILDPSLETVFRQAKEESEVRDSNGNLLGYYRPRSETEEELYARAAKLFDLEEVERRARTETGGSPLQEIMERLRARESHG